MREAKKYASEFIKQRRAMGELDHPDSSVVNLQNVSHNVLEMHWKNNDLVGTVEVLSTPAGNILRELFRNGIKLGIVLGGSTNLVLHLLAIADSFNIKLTLNDFSTSASSPPRPKIIGSPPFNLTTDFFSFAYFTINSFVVS